MAGVSTPFDCERGVRHRYTSIHAPLWTGCALVAIAFLTGESRLQAYIDPGTTGLFLQDSSAASPPSSC